MKKYVLLLIAIQINTSFAGGFMPVGKPGVDEKTYPRFHEFKEDCEKAEEYECHDVGICSTNICELKEEIINGAPIYSPKENVKECAELECKELGPDYCKDFDGYQFFYAKTSIGLGYEAYCAKVVGYEQINTGKHILVESEAKKAAYKAAQAASEGLTKQEIIDLKAAINEIQDVTDIDAATTVAQLRNVTKEKVKRIGRVLKFFMREMKGN